MAKDVSWELSLWPVLASAGFALLAEGVVGVAGLTAAVVASGLAPPAAALLTGLLSKALLTPACPSLPSSV